MQLFLTKILSLLSTQENLCVLHTVSFQGSGAQIPLVVISSVSSLTRENGNTIPHEGGGDWETGKLDRPGKYRAKIKKAGK